MQANIGLQRNASRSLTSALLVVMAAAALLLGAAGGYWARGLASAPAPAVHATSTGPALAPATSTAANERARQRLIDANNFDGSLPATTGTAAPKARNAQHS